MTSSEIKNFIYLNNRIPNVLEALGCHHIKIWDNRISCCNPDGDNPNACNIYLNENLNVINYTRSISQNNTADIFTLIQFYKNYDFREAIIWLHKLLNIDLNYSETKKIDNSEDDKNLLGIFSFEKHKSNISKKNNEKISEEELFDSLPYPHKDFAIDACISRSTIKKFELGYNIKAQRTIIPCRSWKNGDLIGIRGRTSIPCPDKFGIAKYFPLKAFATGQELYGLWENYDEIVKAKKVIIFEGEKSVLKLNSLYKLFCGLTEEPTYGVAVFGHNISSEQANILSGIGLKEITIAFDNDVDISDIKKTYKNLNQRMRVYYLKDEKGILGEKDSPIDKGIKEFAEMYNKRHSYNCDNII